MHIPDGFLAPNICIFGYGVTGGLTWVVLRQINRDLKMKEKIPKASLLTAAFFISALIHIPIPPTSIHLIFNGLLGIILGYYSFLAILIGLFFQAIMFQHGGLSTLGINAIIMGLPALIAYFLFKFGTQLGSKFIQDQLLVEQIVSFLSSAIALGISATLFSTLMIIFIPADLDYNMEKKAIYANLIVYGIQMIIEGVFTMMILSFLRRIKPELLEV